MTWQELYAQCDALRAKGDVEGAAKLCFAVLHERPSFAPALNQLGWLFVMHGRAADGVQYLQKAVEHDREYGDAMFNAGLGFTELRKFDEAIRWFRRALRAKHLSDRASTWWNLSRLYEQYGAKPQALRCVHEALAVSERPPFIEALKRLEGVEPAVEAFDVYALVEAGRVQEAIALLPKLEPPVPGEDAVAYRADVAELAGERLGLTREADLLFREAEAILVGRKTAIEELNRRWWQRYR